MKKIYQKPELELIALQEAAPVMAGSGLTGDGGLENGEYKDNEEGGDANTYTFNLWDEGEE